MLKIHFEAETENDIVTPLSVALALANVLSPVDLAAISDHLKTEVEFMQVKSSLLQQAEEVCECEPIEG